MVFSWSPRLYGMSLFDVITKLVQSWHCHLADKANSFDKRTKLRCQVMDFCSNHCCVCNKKLESLPDFLWNKKKMPKLNRTLFIRRVMNKFMNKSFTRLLHRRIPVLRRHSYRPVVMFSAPWDSDRVLSTACEHEHARPFMRDLH